jgi:hypothetical protein
MHIVPCENRDANTRLASVQYSDNNPAVFGQSDTRLQF